MDIQRFKSDIVVFSRITFSLSGGPGGQNVNKVNTRAVLHLPVEELPSLSEEEKMLVCDKLKNRINSEGFLVVESSATRSQFKNRCEVLRIAGELISDAVKVDPPRRKTRPTGASVSRRLNTKKRRSTIKKNRGKVDPE